MSKTNTGREQIEIISKILGGRSVFAILPTGYGKERLFLLAASDREIHKI